MTHTIRLRTSEITEVNILDEDLDEEKVEIKVEDRKEKKEENNDLDVLDEEVYGTIDENEKDWPKNIVEFTTPSW